MDELLDLQTLASLEFSSQPVRASSLWYLQAPVKATRGLPYVLEETEIADPLVHVEWARKTLCFCGASCGVAVEFPPVSPSMLNRTTIDHLDGSKLRKSSCSTAEAKIVLVVVFL